MFHKVTAFDNNTEKEKKKLIKFFEVFFLLLKLDFLQRKIATLLWNLCLMKSNIVQCFESIQSPLLLQKNTKPLCYFDESTDVKIIPTTFSLFLFSTFSSPTLFPPPSHYLFYFWLSSHL